MLTINGIKKLKHNYQVILSNDEKIAVPEDTIVAFRLLKGTELSEDEVKAVKEHAGFQVGLQQALNYLSYQLRTEKEIHDYLRDHEIPAAQRQQIKEKLKELNLLDDQLYGDSYVRTQMRISDKGPSVLRQKLKQKGLTDEIIENAIALYDIETQIAIATKTMLQLEKRQHHKSHREIQQKLQQGLMQKGFSSEIIQQVLAQRPQEIDDEAELSALVHAGDQLWRRHLKLPMDKRRLKVKQSLYQKGYSLEMIEKFLSEKEEIDE